RYLLMDNRVTEEVEKRYNRAVQALRDLSSGRAELNLPTGENATGSSSGYAVCKDDTDRIFTSDTLKDF
ncbi:phage protein Gp36 family protein, partial [Sansalvadorimonas verongulae]|uniref:phage protein Gp36 family protein n=1 Tax=Sansalvadorimonas verongulae TaxID=2172824 RepID=UPI0012BD0A33